MLLFITAHAAHKPARRHQVRNTQGGLESKLLGFQVEVPVAILQQRLRRQVVAEDVDHIAVNGLVAHRIVAVRGRQPFAGSRATRILLAGIVEQIGDIKESLVAQNVVALTDELVVVINCQDRVQSLRLQTKQLLHRVDARNGVQNEGGI